MLARTKQQKNKTIDSLVYYSLIGEFVVKFNFLEDKMTSLIWTFAKLNNNTEDQAIARIIFKDTLFLPKLKILKNLFKYHFGKNKRFDDICKKLKDINEKRNEFVHSLWFINYASEKDIELKTVIWDNKKISKNLANNENKFVEEKNVDEIRREIINIEELYKEIEFFEHNLLNTIKSSKNDN